MPEIESAPVFADYGAASTATDLIESAIDDLTSRFGDGGAAHAVAAAIALRLHDETWSLHQFGMLLAFYIREIIRHTGELPLPPDVPALPTEPLH